MDSPTIAAAGVSLEATLLIALIVLVLTVLITSNRKGPASPPPPPPPPPVFAPPAYWQQPGFGWSTQPPQNPGRSGPPPSPTARQLNELATSPPSMMSPSMEDVVASHPDTTPPSPDTVLKDLKAGNARFWTGTARRPELSAMERRALIVQQQPKVAVIGCADSRVPVEIVLDQGLGDVFVMRAAGNLYCDTTAGSLDYAIHKLHVPLVVIMGHEGCGAVGAALKMTSDQLGKEPENLRSLVQTIKDDALTNRKNQLATIVDARARDREAVCTVVRSQVRKVFNDPLISAKVKAGELKVVGAFYEISSGLVDFYEYSEAELGSA